MKNQFFLISLLLAFCTGLSAQSAAEEIENLLASRAVTYAQASRIVLEASDKMVTYDLQEAFKYASEKNWLPDKVSAAQNARLDDISLLILNAFDIKGGIFYSITNKSHYAYRELVYLNHIQGRTDPAMNVSGELLLFIISSVLSGRDESPLQENTLAADQEDARQPVVLDTSGHDDELTVQNEDEVSPETDLAQDTALLQNEESAVAESRPQTVQPVTGTITIPRRNIKFPVIMFINNSTELRESEKTKLREIADTLKSMPGVKLMIYGHTALAGTRAGRTIISMRRAQNVAYYLISLGVVNAVNITTVSYGADRPIATNTTPQGMAANRRVEIIISED